MKSPSKKTETPSHPPIGEVEGKTEQVEAMFDGIAKQYDLLNRVLSLGIDQWWRGRAIDLLRGQQPEHVLDVATGTADLAIMSAEQLPVSEVVGIDLSEPMLEIGRQKVAKRDFSNLITLQQADAANLPFEDDAFDAALVAFGVRNFEDLRAGLTEIRRVLRPGGCLVILEFSQPRRSPIKEIYQLYSSVLLPLIGKWISGDAGAYRYLPASVQAFPDGAAFLERMRQADYEHLYWKPLTFGIASLYRGYKPS